MADSRLGPLSGLDLLLEAAAYHDRINMVTPPCGKKRDISSSSHLAQPIQLEPVVCSKLAPTTLPPKKRTKITFGEFERSNPRTASNAIGLYRPIKRSSKCPAGSAHRIWEGMDESAAAAMSARRLNCFNATEVMAQQDDPHAKEYDREDTTFILYEKNDDEYINAVHNVIRRDIWEGFVVDITTDDVLDEGAQDGEMASTSNARRVGRLARYDGTVGFRCRFCKDAPLDQRAEKSAVYPRTLERIYLANIRFQRDHIE